MWSDCRRVELRSSGDYWISNLLLLLYWRLWSSLIVKYPFKYPSMCHSQARIDQSTYAYTSKKGESQILKCHAKKSCIQFSRHPHC